MARRNTARFMAWRWARACLGAVAASSCLQASALGQALPADSLVERASELVGCYSVEFDEWAPQGGEGFVESIPSVIWLTATDVTPDSVTNYRAMVMRPAPGSRQSLYDSETWSLRSGSDTLALRWDWSWFQNVQALVTVTDSSGTLHLNGIVSVASDQLPTIGPDNPSGSFPQGVVSGQSVECYYE